MKQRFYLIAFAVVAMMTAAVTSLYASESGYLFSPKGIPRVSITLRDGKQVGDIKRDEKTVKATKLLADMVITNDNGSTYSDDELYNGQILIKGRGNTSWNLPKRPYSIDLVMPDGDTDNPSPLLGMPEDEEWALVANYLDPTMMRNSLAYYLGSMMGGIGWSPRTRYVEVYINDSYYGIYMLVEKIKRGKKRVNVSKLDPAKNMSGGYVLECIPEDRVKEWEHNTFFNTYKGIHFMFKYPKAKNATQEMVDWIKNYIDEMERALYDLRDFSEETGYRKYVDVDGFYDWIILHDLSKGVDNLFHASVFVEKDKDGPLRMSAPWDFDISFGNHEGQQHDENNLWTSKVHWWGHMRNDPVFAQGLVDRYDELMPVLDRIPAIVAANYHQLLECGALDRDHDRWPDVLNNKSNCKDVQTESTILGHIRWLVEWIESRKAWLYMNFCVNADDNCKRLGNYRPVIRALSPEKAAKGNSLCQVKVMPGYTYVWDGGKRITTNAVYNINDDKEHFVQLKDAHGHMSLPSLPFKRGAAYNDSFGQSLTSGIDDVVTDTSDGIYFTVNSSNGELRISYPGVRACTLDVTVTDIAGRRVYASAVDANEGLGVYDVSLDGVAGGVFIVTVKSPYGSVSRKVTVR